ncbi:helix-turn-helix transcriptional regulator [Paenibacillus vulneris]|uniref:Helix-turn-helix transcriptional regulator n=2 Tax=Paenibacillus TaxID=44249 RepID=A0ABW3UJ84_9BACL
MIVHNRIRDLRIKNNVTQLQLAQDLQVTRQTIIAIENNHYNPSLELSLKIARYFKVSVEDVFTLDHEEESL